MNAIVDVRSRVTRVTVFRQGALVTRHAQVSTEQLEAESHPLRILGLPLALDDTTLVVRAPNHAEAVTARAQVVLELANPAEPRAREVDEELEEAEQAVVRLEAIREALTRQAERWLGTRPPRRVAPHENAPLRAAPSSARQTLLELQEAELVRLDAESTKVSQKLREARQHLVHCRDRVRKAGTGEAGEHDLRKCALITLSGELPAELELELEYQVPGARWSPSYAFRFDSSTGQVAVQLRAQVAQRTGEDWSRVALRLSTADRLRWRELPELKPLRIGRAQAAPPQRGFRPAPMGAEALYEDFLAAERDSAGRAQTLAEQETDRVRLEAIEAEELSRARAEAEHQARREAESDDLVLLEEAPARSSALRMPVSQVKRRQATSGDLELKKAARSARTRAPLPPGPPLAAPAPFVAAAAAAPPAAPAASLEASPPVQDFLLGGGAPGAGFAEPAPAQEVNPTRLQTLDYEAFRMSGALDSQRGYLRLVARSELVLELGVGVANVEATQRLLDEAQSRAFDLKPLPSRHELPRSLNAFDYCYSLEQPVDVPSDGGLHACAVTQSEAPYQLHYVVVPREQSEVFRLAELENPLSGPMLQGPVDVYFDQVYLTTSEVSPTPIQGRIDLGLGVEQRIEVARRCEYREEARGLMRGQLALEHRITIELRNHLPSPAKVEVRERVPTVHESEDTLSVKVSRVLPPWEPHEQKEDPVASAYHWFVELEPGVETSLAFDYEVQLPQRFELVGGNRREP